MYIQNKKEAHIFLFLYRGFLNNTNGYSKSKRESESVKDHVAEKKDA